MERSLYTGPFVVIDVDGRMVATAPSAAEARLLCARRRAGVSVVGTLVEGVWAVDVDPADAQRPALIRSCLAANPGLSRDEAARRVDSSTIAGDGVDPVRGDVAAELLARWAAGRNIPWLVRESGRPGGRHVVVVAGGEVLAELRQRCRELAAEHGVGMTVRKSLRLLTAPHRLGLPAPVLGGTLTERDLDQVDAAEVGPERPHAGDRRTLVAGAAAGQDGSPSAREYGRSFYLARAGYSSGQAWAQMRSCQVTERGFDDWLWFMWIKVVTTVAAEEGLDEAEAWRRAQEACRRRTDALGRDGWRTVLWEPALAEAATERPRRWTAPVAVGERDELPDGPQPRHVEVEVEVLRAGLRAAAAALPDMLDRRGQLRPSMAAFLDVLAEAIAHGGRVSVRRIAEESATARSTVQLRRTEALTAGLIRRVATHRDDGQPCDIYAIGQVAESFVEEARSSRYRSCTPPGPRTVGSADVARMRCRHEAERAQYRPPVVSSTDKEVLEQAYPDPEHHVHAVVQSRVRQRQWWASLSEPEQEERRSHCRARLDRQSADDRDRWLDWLGRREMIDRAIDQLLAGSESAADRRVIEQAPLTVHHGRQDPAWRIGGTPARRPNGPSPVVPVQGTLDLTVVISGPARGPVLDASP